MRLTVKMAMKNNNLRLEYNASFRPGSPEVARKIASLSCGATTSNQVAFDEAETVVIGSISIIEYKWDVFPTESWKPFLKLSIEGAVSVKGISKRVFYAPANPVVSSASSDFSDDFSPAFFQLGEAYTFYADEQDLVSTCTGTRVLDRMQTLGDMFPLHRSEKYEVYSRVYELSQCEDPGRRKWLKENGFCESIGARNPIAVETKTLPTVLVEKSYQEGLTQSSLALAMVVLGFAFLTLRIKNRTR